MELPGVIRTSISKTTAPIFSLNKNLESISHLLIEQYLAATVQLPNINSTIVTHLQLLTNTLFKTIGSIYKGNKIKFSNASVNLISNQVKNPSKTIFCTTYQKKTRFPEQPCIITLSPTDNESEVLLDPDYLTTKVDDNLLRSTRTLETLVLCSPSNSDSHIYNTFPNNDISDFQSTTNIICESIFDSESRCYKTIPKDYIINNNLTKFYSTKSSLTRSSPIPMETECYYTAKNDLRFVKLSKIPLICCNNSKYSINSTGEMKTALESWNYRRNKLASINCRNSCVKPSSQSAKVNATTYPQTEKFQRFLELWFFEIIRQEMYAVIIKTIRAIRVQRNSNTNKFLGSPIKQCCKRSCSPYKPKFSGCKRDTSRPCTDILLQVDVICGQHNNDELVLSVEGSSKFPENEELTVQVIETSDKLQPRPNRYIEFINGDL